jgi:mannitol 2-dehydrogenase
VPEMVPERYFEIERARFANPNIADTIARLCYDGANRQPKFIVPAIRVALERDLPVRGLALSSALWCRYCAGTRDDGTPIVSDDPDGDRLKEAAIAARSEPTVWLDQYDIYGSAGLDARFRDAFRASMKKVIERGVSGAIADFIEGA